MKKPKYHGLLKLVTGTNIHTKMN